MVKFMYERKVLGVILEEKMLIGFQLEVFFFCGLISNKILQQRRIREKLK